MKQTSFRTYLTLAGCVAAVLSVAPAILRADDHGPDPRLTGAPGDADCTNCHRGTALNEGGGSVAIRTASGSTYTPGVKQRITVTVTDAAARRFGFQLTARLASSPASGQAGSFAAVDENAQVICENGRPTPCSSASVIQFAEHNLTGYRSGTNTFLLDWTPPASGAGNVRFYAAGNGANGNGNTSGDHIYTTNIELTPAAASPKPTISSSRGVVNGASFETAIAANTWATIVGTNLATTTRVWSAAEVAGGKLPTSLDGVSVTINGKPAYVQYISPAQINVLSPADDAAGAVEVQVTAGGQTSDKAMATIQALAPAFFTFDGKFLAATHANGALVGRAGLLAAAPTSTSPAKPGETIVLYGTGFGATNPVVAAGEVTTQVAALATTPRVTIGGISATVVFAGLVPNFARLYQFNVTVPESAPDGDLPVVAEIGGMMSMRGEACCSITVLK